MPQKPKKPNDQPPEQADISSDLKQLEEEINQLRTGWQRTQADFENFRRRMVQDQHDRTAYEVANALMAIAPVAENLRRALADAESKTEATPEQMKAWQNGVAQISRQLDQALSGAGLAPICPEPGEDFNPAEHEAISHLPSKEIALDMVIQTVERGYKVGNRVLTPAKVVVSAGSAVDPEK